MKRAPFLSLTFSATFAVAALLAPPAARADILDQPAGTPAWTKTFGNLQVQKFGAGDPALILIPGLACGPWTWYDTIARESKTRAVYSLTVAGFSGLPPAPNPGLDQTQAAILALIQSEHLNRPILIGHSLGGFLALAFGTQHSALVRGIVSVDGLPVFPALAQVTPEKRAADAAQAADAIAKQTPAQYRAAIEGIDKDYVTDPALAAHVDTFTLQSDQKTVAFYTGQLFAADIRPALPQLTAPTLLIGANPALPLPSYLPAQMAALPLDQRGQLGKQFYTSMMTGAPNVTVTVVDNARHFVMLDQPVAFAQVLDGFIAGLK